MRLDDDEIEMVCAIIWRKTSDPVVGWELIDDLNSQDPHIRQVAKQILVECGQPSMNLLESAFALGRVTPESAGDCMPEFFRAQLKQELTDWEQPSS